jgi:cell division topological specificity factor
MSMFSLFRRPCSAPVARDRLQVLLAHERAVCGQSDLLAILQGEIMAVISKHVTVERDNVVVRMDRGATVSTLEIDIEIPSSARTALPSANGSRPQLW